MKDEIKDIYCFLDTGRKMAVDENGRLIYGGVWIPLSGMGG
jgi:hypothetical protein